MGKAHTRWKVLEHTPLQKLAENLWLVEGAVPGMSLRRNMVVAKRADGGLVIHNAMALQPEAMQELEAFGTPRVLVVPNGMHRLDAGIYKQRYPQLTVVAPRGQRREVEEVVPVDCSYEDHDHGGDDSVQLRGLRGVGDKEGVMLVRSADGVSVVLNDVVFNMDRKRDVLGFLFTTVLGSAPGPRISRLAKWMLVDDRRALREELERLAGLPGLVRLFVAHEKVAHGDEARQALLRAVTYL